LGSLKVITTATNSNKQPNHQIWACPSFIKPVFDFLTTVGSIICKPQQPMNEKTGKKQVGHDLSLSLTSSGEMEASVPL